MFKFVFKTIKLFIFIAIVAGATIFIYQRVWIAKNSYIIPVELSQEELDQKWGKIREIEEQIKQKGLEDSQYFDLYNDLGIYYGSIGHMGKAIENYKKASQILPTDDKSRANLASAYARIKDYAKAEKAYLQSIHYNPYQYHVYQGLIQMYKEMGQSKEVITHWYDQALEHANKLADGRPEKVLIDYARYLEDIGEYQQALSIWQNILVTYHQGKNTSIEQEIQYLQRKVQE